MFFLIFFLIVLICAIVNELIHIAVYGWYLSSKWENYIANRLPHCRLNQFIDDIIVTDREPYFSKIDRSILSKWNVLAVNGKIGTIPRWSKMHRMLEAKYNELNPTTKQVYSKEYLF